MALFVLFTFALARGEVGMPILVFMVPMMLIIVQAAGMALFTADRVGLNHVGLTAQTPLGRRDIPWNAIGGFELVDRTDVAAPGRMVMLTTSRMPLFIFDSLSGFDDLVRDLEERLAARARPMPLWKKIAFLQWGAR